MFLFLDDRIEMTADTEEKCLLNSFHVSIFHC